ncbi:hypothetical protein PIB30_104312, partial [Stylosanthes scabra]|nr:hypothetical protein [Stylosanthes scabra]
LPTHMRGSTLSPPPTYPRICVTSNAYAWQPPCFPFPSIMNPLTSPFHQHTHAYALLPTHMRGQLTLYPIQPTSCPILPRICVPSYAYAWDSDPSLNLTAPSHFLTPCHPRICVQPYAYAWNPRTNITPCSPH